MNYKNNPFNQKNKNFGKHWFETKSLTKNQPDKLPIRSKRLTITNQNPKNFTFLSTLCSPPLL